MSLLLWLLKRRISVAVLLYFRKTHLDWQTTVRTHKFVCQYQKISIYTQHNTTMERVNEYRYLGINTISDLPGKHM